MTFRAKICILGELQLNAALIFYLLGEINMKKLFLLFIALVVVGLVACAQETTELRWENRSGNKTASLIKWVPSGYGDIVSFDRTLTADGQQTEFQEINDRYGQGECLLSGDIIPAPIIIDDAYTTGISLPEGASSTYEIRNTAK